MKIDVKLETKDMFRYYLYHTYTSFAGIFAFLLAIGLLALSIYNIGKMEGPQLVLYFGISMLFFVYVPISLYLKAKKQIALNPMFKKTLSYEFTEEGILVTQEEKEEKMEWDNLFKIRETRDSFLIYLSKKGAFIIPRRSVLADPAQLKVIIEKHVKKEKIKWK